MANPQLSPLEVDPKTREPFLRLQSHSDIIITPPRWDDLSTCVPYMNDPLVHQWLQGPPIPYTEDDARRWLGIVKPPSDAALEELELAKDKPDLITVSNCPINSIRKVHDDGNDTFIGAIDITRCKIGELLGPDGPSVADWERKAENAEKNMARPTGDPEIVWTIGDYLAPAYHGNGIMSDALSTILHRWAIPRMGVRKVIAIVFEGNTGSVRVFEKNGFKRVLIIKDHTEVRGEKRTSQIMSWNVPGIRE